MASWVRGSAFVLAFGLAGCGSADTLYQTHEAKSAQEAGEVHVAAGMIAPWDGYVDTLQPHFTMTPDSALALALPQTFMSKGATYDSLGAGLQLGLQQSSQSASTTTAADATGATTTTGTKTDTIAPGTLPASALNNLAAPDITALAGPSGTLQKDAILSYTAATAIYQEVQLLNGYLRDAAFQRGYVPYVVRMPVSVQPHARNQPYDVYVNAGFFAICRNPSKPEDLGVAAPVVPLLVTDDMETGQAANNMEMARQLGLSLGAVLHGLAAQASLNKLNEQLRSLLGTDTNALFTISRGGADNMVNVRIGAQKNPESDYSMTTQNHTVTLIVLVKKEKLDACDAARQTTQLSAMVSSAFRDARTGAPLSQNLDLMYKELNTSFIRVFSSEDLKAAATRFIANGKMQCAPSDGKSDSQNVSDGKGKDKTVATAEQILVFESCFFGPVEASDTDQFKRLLSQANLDETYATSLWVGLSKTIELSDLATVQFDVPARAVDHIDHFDGIKQELIFARDDGNKTVLSVDGFGGGTSSLFRARLVCADQSFLPASSVTRIASGAPLTLQFPSLVPILQNCQAPSAAAIKPVDKKKAPPSLPKLSIQVYRYGSDPRWDEPCIGASCQKAFSECGPTSQANSCYVTFQNIYYLSAKATPTANFSFAAASDTVTADAGGTFQLRLILQNFGADLGSVTIDAVGAAVSSITSDSTTKPQVVSGQIKITLVPAPTAPVVIDTKLTGLTVGHVVSLRATGKASSDGVDSTPVTVTLPIIAAPTQAKSGP